MTKPFTNIQLFSITDGRLSTKMMDIYDMLNHIFNANFFTHQLPGASDKLDQLNPQWLVDARKDLADLNITKETPFDIAMDILAANPKTYEIPQL